MENNMGCNLKQTRSCPFQIFITKRLKKVKQDQKRGKLRRDEIKIISIYPHINPY